MSRTTPGRGGKPSPAQPNVSLRGAGVDLPECQERHRGKHKGTKKSVFFLGGESVAGQRPATPSKKHRLFCAFVLAPASFLTFGKVNPDPLHPPPSLLSAPGPLRLTFGWAGGVLPSLALFLTLGKVNCHRQLGRGGGASD